MTVLVFLILFGLSFVVFPCEGIIKLPPGGDTLNVLKGSDVRIAWTLDTASDLISRQWKFSKTGETIALILEDGESDIKSSSLPRVKIVKPATLVLKNVDLRYNGTYEFFISTLNARDTSYVTVFVAVKPIVTVNCSCSVTVNDGDDVRCLCKGEGGNPPATVTWYKDGVQQGVKGNEKNILSISNVEKTASGTYKCAAQSDVLIDEKSIGIIVYFPPTVTSLTSTPKTTMLGKTVVIRCEAIANPVPRYIIIHNDTVIVSTKKTYIIQVMDYTHAGSYKCIAKNILGNSSKTFSLSAVGFVQKTIVAMATANSLKKVESVVVWHIVLSLLSGIVVGVLLLYIILCSRRRCTNSKFESNPEPETTNKVDSIYQELDLNTMNKEENYESLRAVNSDSNELGGKNESDYTDLKLNRDVEDNYQSLTKT